MSHSTMHRTLFLASLLAFTTPLTAQTPIAAGDVQAGTVTPGDTVVYAFEAGGDALFYAELEQFGADLVVRLVNDEDQQLAQWDATRDGLEPLSRQLPDPDVYRLRIAAAGDEGGEYRLELLQLETRSDDPETLADQLMFPYDRPGGPGGAVQVWRDGRTLFSKAYGRADLTHDVPFTTDTPTNIGSTSKQFTAFAVLLQVERGEVDLDADIRTYVPELPEFDEVITVRHLLTHTSGLREFLNLYALTGWSPASLDRSDVLRAVQRQPRLQNEPGAEFNYNNTAFSLAATVVERTSGQSFDVYLRETVFEPLGMNDSHVRMTPQTVIPGRSAGYAPGPHGWQAAGDLGGAVGAGGIYASVEDLQRWGANLLDPIVGTPDMVRAMRTEYMLPDGEGTGYGFGLFVDEQRGLERVHHGGADVAHRSMLVFFPEIGAGLTAQSNGATFNSQGTAFDLAEAFFGDAMEPEEPIVAEDPDAAAFDPESWDPEEFDRFQGSYAFDQAPQVRVRFWRDGGTLFTQITGQPPLEVEPTGPASVRVLAVAASATFEVEDGEVVGVTLLQNGGQQHASRMADEETEAAPERWQPEELDGYTGRFFSPEIETVYTVSIRTREDEEEEGSSRLILSQMRMGEMVLVPGTETDTFTTPSGVTIDFERDRHGRVVALYASNTRTRDVKFERMGW